MNKMIYLFLLSLLYGNGFVYGFHDQSYELYLKKTDPLRENIKRKLKNFSQRYKLRARIQQLQLLPSISENVLSSDLIPENLLINHSQEEIKSDKNIKPSATNEFHHNQDLTINIVNHQQIPISNKPNVLRPSVSDNVLNPHLCFSKKPKTSKILNCIFKIYDNNPQLKENNRIASKIWDWFCQKGGMKYFGLDGEMCCATICRIERMLNTANYDCNDDFDVYAGFIIWYYKVAHTRDAHEKELANINLRKVFDKVLYFATLLELKRFCAEMRAMEFLYQAKLIGENGRVLDKQSVKEKFYDRHFSWLLRKEEQFSELCLTLLQEGLKEMGYVDDQEVIEALIKTQKKKARSVLAI